MNVMYTILLFFFSACVIILFIWLAYIYYYKEDDIEDRPLCINWMSQFSGNRFLGIETDSKIGKNGRHIIEYLPLDIHSKNIKSIQREIAIIDKNKIISFPKGSLSRDKNLNMYLPPTASDFNDNIKNTEFGKILMWITELKNADNTVIDALKESNKRQAAIVKDLAFGEATIKKMKQLQTYQDDAINSITKGINKQRAGISSLSGGGGIPSAIQ